MGALKIYNSELVNSPNPKEISGAGGETQPKDVSGTFAEHLQGALDAAAAERLDRQIQVIKHKAGLVEGVSTEEQRSSGLEQQKEQLWEAALELEALFLQQMISAMQRTVSRGGGVFAPSKAEELFRGMLDEQWAELMAESGDIGLARSLYDQLVESLLEREKADSES